MSEETLRYFELNDDVGLAPAWIVDPETGLEIPNEKAGEPEALNNIGIQIPIPVQLDNGDIVETTTTARLVPGDELDELTKSRIIPDTRVIETAHPAVGSLLLETGLCHEVDPPKASRPRAGRPTNPPAETGDNIQPSAGEED